MLSKLIQLFKPLKPVINDRRGEVAELTRHNSSEAYDRLWKDDELLSHYLEPARLEGYRLLVKYILSKNVSGKIVELGFGSADFLKILLEESEGKSFDIYGLDYAASGVDRASKLIPSGTFLQGDIYSLPYNNSYFDQVYCLQTLEHLKEPMLALKEMDRVCKADGMILLTIPNGDLDDFEGHVQFWSESSFRDFLAPHVIIDFIRFNEDRAMMVSLKPLKGLTN